MEDDLAAGRVADAGENFEQLRLAVAGDAGDADDLAGADLEGNVGEAAHALCVDIAQVLHLQQRRARHGRLLRDPQQHAAADHQLGKFLRRGLRCLARRHHLAAAHHRDLVGHRHDLAQLVGDEDDRLSLLLQLAKDAEEMIGLVGRQHSRRLVEDQRVGAAIERLQDLDALLQADRQFARDGVRIDLQRVFALEPLQLGAHMRDAAFQERAAFDAEHDVFQDRERLHQHEVLVHHADARRDRRVGGMDGGFLAVDADRAGIGMVEAVEDRHQRRLAGAVLADDPVDRPLGDREVDVLVGVNRAEALVDADQLDGGRRRLRRGAHRTSSMPNGPAATRSGGGDARISAQ